MKKMPAPTNIPAAKRGGKEPKNRIAPAAIRAVKASARNKSKTRTFLRKLGRAQPPWHILGESALITIRYRPRAVLGSRFHLEPVQGAVVGAIRFHTSGRGPASGRAREGALAGGYVEVERFRVGPGITDSLLAEQDI